MTPQTEALETIRCLEHAETLEAMLACPFDEEKLFALLASTSLQEARELRERILTILGKLNSAIRSTEHTLRDQGQKIAHARRHSRAGLTYLSAAKLS